MNFIHRRMCSSDRWIQTVQMYALPWALDGIDLGAAALEIGPGYGAATDVLQRRVARLTCVESDCKLADRLRDKVGVNVVVKCEDATAMSLPDNAFESVVCFTTLHYVGSVSLQNQLFAEVARVLKPDGIFAGTDSVKTRFFRLLHLFDTLVLVSPETLSQRLADVGFEDVRVDRNPYAFRFRAQSALKSCIARFVKQRMMLLLEPSTPRWMYS